jgi:glycosyltransferase involved in cell wall biosynthesis
MASEDANRDYRPMKCSVLLPVYNAGAALQAAIESILGQDEGDFEFLITDDCSTDDSANVIRRYAASDARIRPTFHARNAGVPFTLNEGLAAARCELVVKMDQDDISLPGRIGTQVEFLRQRPEVAVAGSFVYHMGRRPADDRLVRLPVEHEAIVRTLARENCMYHPSVIMRRDAIRGLGGYRMEFLNSEDYDLWLRVAKVHKLANIPEPLLRYRFSVNGVTLGRKWEQALYAQMASISSLHPEWSLERVRQEAAAELERVGKGCFLEQVARGTTRELIGLRMYSDAWRILRSFARQMEARRVPGLVREFMGALVRSGFRASGKAG